MNLKKLLAKGHLVPIYNVTEDAIFLIGYRRKSYSRKSSQRPYMLNAPVPIAKLPLNPESTPITE